MLLAYIIYTFLPLMFLICYNKIQIRGRWALLPLILYSIIIGLRFNVGIDYMSYYEAYVNPSLLDPEVFEVGYIYLNKVLQFVDFPPCSIFIISAFLQIFGVYYLAKDDFKIYKYAFIFYFLTLAFFFALNGIRQSIAIGILLIAVKQIYDKKLLKYICLVFFATLFHRSAIIFLPFYFLIDKVKINLKISLLLYFLSFFLSNFVLELFWNNFSLLANYAGYSDRANNVVSAMDIDWSNTGAKLGVYLWLIIDTLIIYFYHKYLNKKKQKGELQILYNFYLLGICFSNLVAGSYFDRIAQYFIIFKIFIYAHVFYYVYNILKSKNAQIVKIITSILLLILVVFYYNAIFKNAGLCSPFQFIN